nr:hypothetical protein [Tanacetum cinerariifolium]
IQAPFQNRFRDFPEADMKEILHQQMWETNSYKAHEDHMMLYEARERKKRHDSPKTPPGSSPHQPPPPPPPAVPSRTSRSPRSSGSSQSPPPPPPPSTSQSDHLKAQLPQALQRQLPQLNIQLRRLLKQDSDWWKPLEEDIPATPEPAWSIPSSDLPVPMNNWASALVSTYTPPPKNSLLAQTGDMAIFIDCILPNGRMPQLLTDGVDESIIMYNISKPLPLVGPPDQLIIQSDFFFNKDLEYLRYGSKGGRPALSILMMKAAYYPDIGLEQIGILEICYPNTIITTPISKL